MNIHEIAEKYKLGLVKVRRMQGEGHPMVPAMRANLWRGQALSVAQLFALIESPEIFAELRTKQSQARAQIEALGAYDLDKPAASLLRSFADASENDSDAIKACIRWLKSILPVEPVPYAWLAVRVAQGITDVNARQDFLLKFGRAMHFVCLAPDFAGWHTMEKFGHGNRKIYFRPTQIFLDL